MAVDIVMPQMGESIFEGTITKWLKKPGDKVERDEPLFEISTDKVDAEIPSPSAGVLKEIKVAEGKTVPIQTVVGVIDAAGDASATGAAKPAPQAAAPNSDAPPSKSAQAPRPHRKQRQRTAEPLLRHSRRRKHVSRLLRHPHRRLDRPPLRLEERQRLATGKAVAFTVRRWFAAWPRNMGST